MDQLLQLEYTIGHEQHYDPYQIVVVRNAMTRNIGVCFPDIRNELVAAFEDLVPATTGGKLTVLETYLRFMLHCRMDICAGHAGTLFFFPS
jgi:hypothetical protein